MDDRQLPRAGMIRAYLVDDEPPALDRLARMLELSGRVQIAGA